MRVGFSIDASGWSSEYSEAVMIYTICLVMHYYPSYTKNEVLELTQSQISHLIEMAGCIENPKSLEKYKKLRFNSKFEFEQYILQKFKLT